jgi:hypothetical protein
MGHMKVNARCCRTNIFILFLSFTCIFLVVWKPYIVKWWMTVHTLTILKISKDIWSTLALRTFGDPDLSLLLFYCLSPSHVYSTISHAKLGLFIQITSTGQSTWCEGQLPIHTFITGISNGQHCINCLLKAQDLTEYNKVNAHKLI